MSLLCRNPSDSFSYSLQTKAKLFTMARKDLYDQDSCYLSVLYLLLLLTLFQPHWPPCCLSMPKYSWFLYVFSHCLDCFSSGHPHDTSPPLSSASTLSSLVLSPAFDIAYFLPLPETILLAPGYYIFLELFIPVWPFIFWSLSWAAPPLSPLKLPVSISNPL